MTEVPQAAQVELALESAGLACVCETEQDNYGFAETYSVESEDLHLNTRCGDWWGTSTVCSGIHEVVFLFVFEKVLYDRIP